MKAPAHPDLGERLEAIAFQEASARTARTEAAYYAQDAEEWWWPFRPVLRWWWRRKVRAMDALLYALADAKRDARVELHERNRAHRAGRVAEFRASVSSSAASFAAGLDSMKMTIQGARAWEEFNVRARAMGLTDADILRIVEESRASTSRFAFLLEDGRECVLTPSNLAMMRHVHLGGPVNGLHVFLEVYHGA